MISTLLGLEHYIDFAKLNTNTKYMITEDKGDKHIYVCDINNGNTWTFYKKWGFRKSYVAFFVKSPNKKKSFLGFNDLGMNMVLQLLEKFHSN